MWTKCLISNLLLFPECQGSCTQSVDTVRSKGIDTNGTLSVSIKVTRSSGSFTKFCVSMMLVRDATVKALHTRLQEKQERPLLFSLRRFSQLKKVHLYSIFDTEENSSRVPCPLPHSFMHQCGNTPHDSGGVPSWIL